MRKVLSMALVLVLVLAMSVTLVACGGGTSSGTYDMTVWCAELDYDMISEMLYEYEQANPDNKYNFTIQKVGEDVAATRVIADPTTAADVYSFASDQLGKLVTNNAILPVPTAYQSEIKNDQILVAATAAQFNGTLYAYPYTYENCFLYYNKSMLTESQVGSLETILKTTTTAKDANLGINMDDAYYTSMFLFTAGMQLFGADGQDVTDVDIANDYAIKGCEYIQSLGSQAKFKSIVEADQTTALQNGNVAAIISGPHMVEQFKAALGEDYAVAKLPTIQLDGKATQLVSFSGLKMYGVNSKTKYPEESAKLAAFLSNADNQLIRLEDREFCPTNSELYDQATSSNIAAVEVVIEQAEYTLLKPAFTQMDSYWTPMGTFLKGVFTKAQPSNKWLTELTTIENGLKAS